MIDHAASPRRPRPGGPVLVLGGGGMLGHKLWQVLAPRFDTHVTIRESAHALAGLPGFDRSRCHEGIDITATEQVLGVVRRVRPAAIINAVGIIKQRAAAKDPVAAIQVNALFPHLLHDMARAVGAYLIHVSTDCVFSGNRGNYTEDDLPDPPDLYGRSKLLGEIDAPDCLTLRTSIIGQELRGGHGLVEWFLGQEGGRVSGFANAIYSGVPTVVLATMIAELLEREVPLVGLYHLASAPISKYDLLLLVRDAFGVRVEVERDEAFRCDRGLNADRLRAATGMIAPPWPVMVERMAAESAMYARTRSIGR
jgi:dTDP-4-dehydrorhamnose reductase